MQSKNEVKMKVLKYKNPNKHSPLLILSTSTIELIVTILMLMYKPNLNICLTIVFMCCITIYFYITENKYNILPELGLILAIITLILNSWYLLNYAMLKYDIEFLENVFLKEFFK